MAAYRLGLGKELEGCYLRGNAVGLNVLANIKWVSIFDPLCVERDSESNSSGCELSPVTGETESSTLKMQKKYRPRGSLRRGVRCGFQGTC
eukprot:3079150-Pleurochrysis_carterae.AAC.2